ncbi:MAG: hypothetical protein AAF806_19040 [Bacteroidota bacterium]
MAKLKDNKGFKAGLESLLLDALQEEQVQRESSTPTRPSQRKGRVSSSKSFASDLSSLFEESIVESVQEKVKSLKEKPEQSDKKKEKKRPTGLDVLIRRTVESSNVDIEDGPKRRVTFLFDEDKLKRLKDIARSKKAYIKDIVGEIVSEFIEEYEEENGKIG